ncbi:MAG: helix-turn-helix domain-containing protein [Bryobacteraceae bacterium]|nr:helix-turn-helix domain-containing protein [Bryobacteraceae bacterium]
MRLRQNREWYEKHAALDQPAEIAAGGFSLDQLPPSQVDVNEADLAFGRLINLSRRNRGWSIEELSTRARVEVNDLVRIEKDPHFVPGPRTVYQLANLLGFRNDRLLQLSGNTKLRDRRLGENAVKFAARSEPLQALDPAEQNALEEFVKYLSE